MVCLCRFLVFICFVKEIVLSLTRKKKGQKQGQIHLKDKLSRTGFTIILISLPKIGLSSFLIYQKSLLYEY